jgi:hypothetical protein
MDQSINQSINQSIIINLYLLESLVGVLRIALLFLSQILAEQIYHFALIACMCPLLTADMTALAVGCGKFKWIANFCVIMPL